MTILAAGCLRGYDRRCRQLPCHDNSLWHNGITSELIGYRNKNLLIVVVDEYTKKQCGGGLNGQRSLYGDYQRPESFNSNFVPHPVEAAKYMFMVQRSIRN